MHRDKKFRIFQAKCSHYPIRYIPCFRFVVFLPGWFNSWSIALYFIHQTSCNWCLCFTTLDFKVKLYCGVKKLSLIISESLLELHIASLAYVVCFVLVFSFVFVIFADQNESQGVCLTENHMLLILTTANVTFGAKIMLAWDERRSFPAPLLITNVGSFLKI